MSPGTRWDVRRTFAAKIVAQGGDYVLAVKDNQKHLSQAVVEFFATAEAFDFRNIEVQKRVWVDKDHGRLEARRAAFVTDASWTDKPMRESWKKLAGVGMICRHDRVRAGDQG